ncbi:MAG: transporter [Candidatus Dactylopiibacterium carminicum]|uniref:Tim44 domain-containing protein n=1 Tax=Candidatus Dactylopiibacterium carminicum TaxID=857335 RepID=A0A272EMY3_9RHOO|nr:TIM44-like domain-containing protein [Candidatus Dactylopiibacterium carminicum]KAF7597895.1 Tim44 domain-containing protein [Candidatus Dactylopiibacterium carminicum]PAS91478.1 MAG: transporter [Candidatus Dactylopiibacterium carminicum]PAS92929.1 MAG: transporter [Candidatus Dactylopiibacterium carminicum]PAS95885.1 MAG: hypothetical protein BSR46_16245 [Candidatus Dactylopiibacterium carminicum]
MLKKFMLLCGLLVVGFGSFISIAEAKRFGGGRSVGIQRQVAPPQRQMPPTANPAQANARPAAPGAQAPASGLRKWGAPLAALATGLGIAALLSHFGVGAEFAGIILIAVVAMLGFALLRRLAGGNNANAPKPAWAGAAEGSTTQTPQAEYASSTFGGTTRRWPAEFDVESFERQAKLNFIRLQAANDAGDLADIRDFTSPEIFAEIKLGIDERQGRSQKTDVVELHAEVLEVVEENGRYIASVHYSGTLREEIEGGASGFDEIWHLTKPVDGNRGWQLAGIQQRA